MLLKTRITVCISKWKQKGCSRGAWDETNDTGAHFDDKEILCVFWTFRSPCKHISNAFVWFLMCYRNAPLPPHGSLSDNFLSIFSKACKLGIGLGGLGLRFLTTILIPEGPHVFLSILHYMQMMLNFMIHTSNTAMFMICALNSMPGPHFWHPGQSVQSRLPSAGSPLWLAFRYFRPTFLNILISEKSKQIQTNPTNNFGQLKKPIAQIT